jgi:hypothetical protein
MTADQLRALERAHADWELDESFGQSARELQLINAVPLLIADNRRLEHAARYDPFEVYEVRTQIDQKVYVSGTIDEIARAAFHAGYARAIEDTTGVREEGA